MTASVERKLESDSRQSRQLWTTARVGLAGLLVYCVYQGWSLRGYEVYLAVACIVLAALPALRWIKTQPYRFPAFETFMLTIITSYVLPLVNEHETVMSYSDDVVTRAMEGVLLFQVCAVVVFFNLKPTGRPGPFWSDELFSRNIDRWLPIGLWLHVGYLTLDTFTTLVPDDIDSILRAIFFGISTACSFLLGRSWGDGKLPAAQKTNIVCAMMLEVLLQLLSLYLITSISGVIVFFLAYVSAGRRIPWVTLAAIFVVFSVLHNGKTEMREKYWAEGYQAPGVTDMPSFFGEWVNDGLRPSADADTAKKKNNILDRASLLQMLCLVIDATDRNLPLLRGETYGYILPQLVPRIIWPDKPSGQLTSTRLGVYFGLQDADAARNTSIAFGALAEAYANFGLLGMALLGLCVGCAGKAISIWTRTCPLLSNGGLIMILVMAWSIQVELPLSVWIASIYQAAICVLVLPFVVRLFLR